ncbi:helix-turn-helix transcriptional regulator [Belnapia sp. T18]|uniref:Helix-turn-helix transcriptional regulator n=1 Tax=Belnapia arida TaxID=2804533 RepID=A0ABS1UCH3_9PROT|nr:helix-turn-helix transcriptional regulator [Belnapia arida]MBL6081397.1 helix-turn-helix transcriptional regulator [Belnapia arida]
MSSQAVTFGQAIANARRQIGVTQKDLASMVMKEDGSGAISAPYLNDIEHDRRRPTSDSLIRELAKATKLDVDYLFVLAGKIPEEVRQNVWDADAVASAFRSFRKACRSQKRPKQQGSR